MALALVPAVVATRDQMHAMVEQVEGDVLGEAKARGSVLGVRYHEVHAVLSNDSSQALPDSAATRPAEDIADHHALHRL